MRFLLLIGVVAWHAGIFNLAASQPSSSEHASLAKQSLINFSETYFKAMVRNAKNNFLYSPTPAWELLALTARVARGTTQSQIYSVLDLPPTEGIAVFPKVRCTKNAVGYELRQENTIFLNHDLKLHDDFDDCTRAQYRSIHHTVDFADSVNTAGIINGWTAYETNNRIGKTVEPAALKADPKLFLANAIYFKASWETKFETKDTTMKPFHVGGTTTKNVPTMKISGNFGHNLLRNVEARFVELPYKVNDEQTEDVSMFVVLPNEVDGLSNVVENLNFAELLETVTNSASVQINLPKFAIESSSDLADGLVKMGSEKMFSSSAEFAGISYKPKLKMGGIAHKAFIEVNEEGSEMAGDADGVVNSIKDNDNNSDRPLDNTSKTQGEFSRPETTTESALHFNGRQFAYMTKVPSRGSFVFDVSHPFLIVIADKTRKIPISIAIVTDPTGSTV